MCKTLLTPPREADEKRKNLSKQAPAANPQHVLLSSSTKQAETHETLSPDIKREREAEKEWESRRVWRSG